jgi:predicted sugar kinase
VTGGSAEARAFVTEQLTAAGVGGVRLAIRESPPDHVGLGSKTTIALACAEAASRHSGKRSPGRISCGSQAAAAPPASASMATSSVAF